MNFDELLTTAEVADELGVSIASVGNYARKGVLKEVKKGNGLRGQRLFTRTAVDAFKQQRETVG